MLLVLSLARWEAEMAFMPASLASAMVNNKRDLVSKKVEGNK